MPLSTTIPYPTKQLEAVAQGPMKLGRDLRAHDRRRHADLRLITHLLRLRSIHLMTS